MTLVVQLASSQHGVILIVALVFIHLRQDLGKEVRRGNVYSSKCPHD